MQICGLFSSPHFPRVKRFFFFGLFLDLGLSSAGSSYVSGGYSTGTSYNSLQSPASAPPPQPPPQAPPPPPVFPPQPPMPPVGRNEPYFDPMTPRNVTALVGKSAYLSCRVRNLGNKTVSGGDISIRHA
ncbi:hypothetical protein J437_LFUL019582 [Ladona fulva]|nr:hypothetical protein J437_LFUL019582 [Ladona fulva]